MVSESVLRLPLPTKGEKRKAGYIFSLTRDLIKKAVMINHIPRE